MVLAVIGVALLAAIVTFLVLLAVRPPKRQAAVPPTTAPSTSASSSSTIPTIPAAPPITAAELRQLTDELVPFIEATRQLRFTTAPRPSLDSDSDFVKAFDVEVNRTAPTMRRLRIPFSVLGLSPGPTDLVAAQRAFYGNNGIVFYDPTTNVVHVRRVGVTPYLKAMLVTGLTEQLDDQHFDIGRMDASTGFGDEAIGMRTIAMGDGFRIAGRWLARQSLADQDEATNEARARRSADPAQTAVPPALQEWLALPNDVGATYTGTLAGASTLDAAFRAPPDGSAQVVAIGRYQASLTQLPVAVPTSDEPASASGTFGYFFLNEVLQGVASDDVRSRALAGYQGDSMVTWVNGSQSCVRMDVTTGDSDPGNMRRALTEWSTKFDGKVSMQPDAKRPGEQVVRLDVCSRQSDGGSSSSSTTTTIPASPGRPGPGPTTIPSPY
jgi:hypothetical protein